MVTKSFFKSDLSEAEKIKQLFESTLKGIREEFDDHRETINDNTNEIQANYEYISRIDEKINKLSTRLGQIETWMSRMTGVSIPDEEDQHIRLTDKEKQVFLILYTASVQKPVTYAKIARYLDENDFTIRGYVTNMLEKGVLIQKQYVGGQVFLSIDRMFKEKQTKGNILGINQKTVKEFLG